MEIFCRELFSFI